MTRDEAKQRCASLLGAMDWGMRPDDRATLLIDGFVLLGMLKLDEPKSVWDKFNQIVLDWVDPLEVSEFFTDMEKAGLKIVEK